MIAVQKEDIGGNNLYVSKINVYIHCIFLPCPEPELLENMDARANGML